MFVAEYTKERVAIEASFNNYILPIYSDICFIIHVCPKK